VLNAACTVGSARSRLRRLCIAGGDDQISKKEFMDYFSKTMKMEVALSRALSCACRLVRSHSRVATRVRPPSGSALRARLTTQRPHRLQMLRSSLTPRTCRGRAC
jgi:hypothetical protein